jgi:hypothetical protein
MTQIQITTTTFVDVCLTVLSTLNSGQYRNPNKSFIFYIFCYILQLCTTNTYTVIVRDEKEILEVPFSDMPAKEKYSAFPFTMWDRGCCSHEYINVLELLRYSLQRNSHLPTSALPASLIRLLLKPKAHNCKTSSSRRLSKGRIQLVISTILPGAYMWSSVFLPNT